MTDLSYRAVVLALVLGATQPAFAAEGQGCGAFRWSPAAAQQLVEKADQAAVSNGSRVDGTASAGFSLMPSAASDTNLPQPPERPAPFAGWVALAVPADGIYEVALSGEGWIDLVENGAYVKAAEFTGAEGCPGVRKMVRFALHARQATLQVSASQPRALHIAIRQVERN